MTAPRPSRWSRSARWWPLAFGAAVVLPLVALTIHVAASRHVALDGDTALIELRTRDVFTRHVPLVGSYDRFGWNMPGPALFAWLAIPYRLLGSRYGAIQAGAVLLALASVAIVLVVAWRRGRWPLLIWTAALLGVLVHGLGAAALASPWEPNAVVLPTLAMLALAWEVLEGARWAIVPAVLAASFVGQASASLTGIAVVVGAVATVAAIVFAVRRGDGRWWPIAVALGVGALVWLPPLVDQAAHHPGNLQRLVDFARHGSRPIGWHDGYRLVAIQWGLHAPWSGSGVPLLAFRPTVDLGAAPTVPWALVALVVAGVAALLRRRFDAARLAALVAVVAVAYVAVFSRLTGPVLSWVGHPARPIGFACWWAAGWCAWRAVVPDVVPSSARVRHAANAVLVAMSVVAIGAATATTIAAVRHTDAPSELSAAAARLVARAAPVLRAGDRAGGRTPVVVRSTLSASSTLFGNATAGREALVLALEHAGIAARVDPSVDAEVRFGKWRTDATGITREVLLTSADAPPPPGFRVLAITDPLSASQRARRDDAARHLPADPRELLALLRRDPAALRLWADAQRVPDLPRIALLVGPANAATRG